MHEPYLTEGVPVQHVDAVRTLRDDNPSNPNVPAPMNPLGLHLLPPLPLPVDSVRDGADLVDQQWSRRQFSVLWAPMPADYQFDGEVGQKVMFSLCAY